MAQGGHVTRVSSHGKPLAAVPSHRRRPHKAVDVHATKRSANASIAMERYVDSAAELKERLAFDAGRDAAVPDLQSSPVDLGHLLAERTQLERTFHIDFPRTPAAHRLSIEHDWKQQRESLGNRGHINSGARKFGSQRVSRSARRRTSKLSHSTAGTELSGSTGSSDSASSFGVALLQTDEFLQRLEREVALGRKRAGSRSTGEQSAVAMYQLNMGETRVLTRKEEVMLFSILRRCSDLGIEHSARGPTAAHDVVAQRAELASGDVAKVVEQARRAHALVMQFNMRLVFATAARFASAGMPFSDLLPEGMLGVEAAMQRFDERRGFKFSTLAVWHVRQKMRRCIQQQARVVHVPVHVQDRLPRILRARAELQAARPQGEPVLHADIAAAVGMDVAKVAQTLSSHTPVVHLEERAYGSSSGGDVSVLDCLEDDSMEDALASSQQLKVVHESLNAVLATLQPRERNILRLRYGLNSEGRRVPRSEIAEAYGLTHERIRQIEDRAVEKLTKPWRLQFLRDFSAGAV